MCEAIVDGQLAAVDLGRAMSSSSVLRIDVDATADRVQAVRVRCAFSAFFVVWEVVAREHDEEHEVDACRVLCRARSERGVSQARPGVPC